MRGFSALVGIGLLVAGCSGSADQAPPTATPMTTEADAPTEPDDPSAPTEEAFAANQAFLEIPAGYADCGAAVMTSGWPTTTVFNPEVELTCLTEAIASQAPSQYVYWGRAGSGGISGAIIRVDSSGMITFVEYSVDPEGNVTSSNEECGELESDIAQPPVCVRG